MVYLRWDNPKDMHLLINCVLQKQIFIGSTDTVLGLMAIVDPQVKCCLDKIKIRSGKAYIVLVDTIDKVEQLCVIPSEKMKRFFKLCWPGPVTVILDVKPEHIPCVGSSTIALRIPNHQGLQQLLSNLPYGLYSTSANVSGGQVACSFEYIPEHIKQNCAYYIDNGKAQQQIASTIIDCSQGDIRVVRAGLYSVEALHKLYDAA